MLPLNGTPTGTYHTADTQDMEDIALDLYDIDPLELPEVFESIGDSSEESIEIQRSLLHQILVDDTHTEAEKGELLGHLFSLFPLSEIMIAEAAEQGEGFSQLYSFIEGDEQRRAFVRSVIESRPENPYQSLVQMIPLFSDTTPGSSEEKSTKLQEFISSIPDESCTAFFDRVVEELPVNTLGKVLALIEEEALIDACLARFMQRYEEQEDFPTQCQTLIQAYTLSLSENGKSRAYLLQKLLGYHEDTEWLRPAIYDLIDYYLAPSIPYLIKEGTKELRSIIMRSFYLNNELEEIDPFLESLFEIVPEQEKRLEIIRDLFDTFEFDEYEDVLRDLGMSESMILPYLFVALSDECFNFLVTQDPEMFSETARCATHISPNQLQDLVILLYATGRAHRMLTNCRLDIASQEFSFFPVNYTMHSLFELIDHMIQQENSDQSLEDYQEDLQDIPEFLLSVAMRETLFRIRILCILRFLKDSQIQAVAKTIPETVLGSFLDQASLQLLGNQFGTLLLALPRENLIRYVQSLTERLDEASFALNEGHWNCSLMLDGKDIPLARDAYEQYVQAAQKLQLPLWSFIARYLQQLSDEIPEIQNLLIKIRASRAAIIRFPAERKELLGVFDALEPKDIDEKERPISNGYWDLIVAAHLPHLEIDHFSEIQSRGIQSDQDFALLGLGPEIRTALDRICQAVNRLENDETGTQIMLYEKWEALLQTALEESGDLEEKQRDLLDSFHLDGSLEQTTQLQELLASIQEFHWINDEQRRKAWFLSERALFFETEQERRAFCLQSIKFCIHLTLEHNFLLKLKRYLTQTQIEPIWQYFSLINVPSVQALMESGLVASPNQLFDLLSLAVMMGYSDLPSEEVSESETRDQSMEDSDEELLDGYETENEEGDPSSSDHDSYYEYSPLPTPPSDGDP